MGVFRVVIVAFLFAGSALAGGPIGGGGGGGDDPPADPGDDPVPEQVAADSSGNPWVNWGAQVPPIIDRSTTRPANDAEYVWMIIAGRYYPSWIGSGAGSLNQTVVSGFGPAVFASKQQATDFNRRAFATSGGWGGVPLTRAYLGPYVDSSTPSQNPNSGSQPIFIDWNGSVASPALAINGDVVSPSRVFVSQAEGDTYFFSSGQANGASGDRFNVVMRWQPNAVPAGAGVPNQLTLTVQRIAAPTSQPTTGDASTQPAPSTQPLVAEGAVIPGFYERDIYKKPNSASVPSFKFRGANIGGYSAPEYTVTFSQGKANFVPLQYFNNMVTACIGAMCCYWVLDEFRRN